MTTDGMDRLQEIAGVILDGEGATDAVMNPGMIRGMRSL
jgi:hypothetical protein